MAKKPSPVRTSGVISFRGGEAEHLALRDIAERLNVSESEAARSVIRVCAGTGLMLEPVDRKQFTSVAEGLRQTGININQAVRAMNTGRVPDDAKFRSDLSDLAAGMTAISELLVSLCARTRGETDRRLRGVKKEDGNV